MAMGDGGFPLVQYTRNILHECCIWVKRVARELSWHWRNGATTAVSSFWSAPRRAVQFTRAVFAACFFPAPPPAHNCANSSFHSTALPKLSLSSAFFFIGHPSSSSSSNNCISFGRSAAPRRAGCPFAFRAAPWPFSLFFFCIFLSFFIFVSIPRHY